MKRIGLFAMLLVVLSLPVWLSSDAGESYQERLKHPMSWEHHRVHTGETFTASYEDASTGAVKGRAIAFNTPNTTTLIHMVADVVANDTVYYYIVEGPSITVDQGTQRVVSKCNRGSSNASVVTSIETAPTANEVTTYNDVQYAAASFTITTKVWEELIYDGINKATMNGAPRGSREFVLAPNTQYAVVVLNGTANATNAAIAIRWYETDDQ